MKAPISVVIPTYKRTEKLLETIEQILSCEPQPTELLVHVDGDDEVTAQILKQNYTQIRIIQSTSNIGPGAGRNKLISAASEDIVVGFDDDSYPIDQDYFQRILHLFSQYPCAAILAAKIFHLGEPLLPDENKPMWVANYIACGCVYRREPFLQANGHIQRLIPYGMEENDLALRLHAKGWRILETPELRVFHNTYLQHHESAKVTAGIIENVALHAFLRYPSIFWAYGFIQCLNQVIWRASHGRQEGIWTGIRSIPRVIWQHKNERQPVPTRQLVSYLRMRRKAIPVEIMR